MQMMSNNLQFDRAIGMPARAGEILFLRGEPCEHLFEVRRGVARAVATSYEGDRQVLAFFFPGDVFGLPLADEHRFSAEAVTDIIHTKYSSTGWQTQLAQTCQQEKTILNAVWQEEKAFIARGLVLGRVTALARLSAFLIALTHRLPSPEGLCALELPQTDIASYLATSPETVCRNLRHLRELKVIAMPRRDRFAVLHPGRLEMLAEGIHN